MRAEIEFVYNVLNFVSSKIEHVNLKGLMRPTYLSHLLQMFCPFLSSQSPKALANNIQSMLTKQKRSCQFVTLMSPSQ